MVDVCCAGPASSCEVVGDSRDPTVAARFLLDKLLQRSSSTVVTVLVIMRDGGNAPDSGHREIGGHSSSQQRQVLDSQQWYYGGDDGLFRRILSHFSRSSGCPRVERQFSERPRALTAVSARGLLHNFMLTVC